MKKETPHGDSNWAMNWQVYTSPSSSHSRYDGLRIGDMQVSFPAQSYRRIRKYLAEKKLERVTLYYDLEKKAVRVEPKKNGHLRFGSVVSTPLSKIMPMGRYYFKEWRNGFIFVHE